MKLMHAAGPRSMLWDDGGYHVIPMAFVCCQKEFFIVVMLWISGKQNYVDILYRALCNLCEALVLLDVEVA